MATYYTDSAAAGANDGTSWTDAWTNFQSALDAVAVGNECKARGTFTLAAQLDIDTNSGTAAGGRIAFIGCNAAGTEDGTKVVIDGNSAVANCLDVQGMDYLEFRNFEIKNATAYGIDFNALTASNWYCANVYVYNCATHNVFSNTYNTNSLWERCRFENCTNGDGFYKQGAGCLFLACDFMHNGNDGLDTVGNAPTFLVGCVLHGNTDDGLVLNSGGVIIHCVIDGNGDDGVLNYYGGTTFFIGNRITNHSGADDIGIGQSQASVTTTEDYNYFDTNTVDLSNVTAGAHSLVDQGDADRGYVDSANHDFNIVAGMTLANTPVEING